MLRGGNSKSGCLEVSHVMVFAQKILSASSGVQLVESRVDVLFNAVYVTTWAVQLFAESSASVSKDKPIGILQ